MYTDCGHRHQTLPRLIDLTGWFLFLLSLVSSCLAAQVDIGRVFSLHPDYPIDSTYMGVRFLGTFELRPTLMNGYRPRGLSALAWDPDQGRLYAVSDRGFIVHLVPFFSSGRLVRITMTDIFPLRAHDGRKLSRFLGDAEGLSISAHRDNVRANSELQIAFENRPRVERYDVTGKHLGTIPLPAPLAAKDAYRHRNKELESLARHPRYGLLTAPELPLTVTDEAVFTIFSLRGRQWQYAPLDFATASISGMEVTPDGSLLLLERQVTHILRPIIYALRRLELDDTEPTTTLVAQDLLILDSSQGWALDNFEAIAWHEGDRYFLLSDDNQNPWQKTLLVYLQLLTLPARTDGTR